MPPSANGVHDDAANSDATTRFSARLRENCRENDKIFFQIMQHSLSVEIFVRREICISQGG
jgi:hypothetical protein